MCSPSNTEIEGPFLALKKVKVTCLLLKYNVYSTHAWLESSLLLRSRNEHHENTNPYWSHPFLGIQIPEVCTGIELDGQIFHVPDLNSGQKNPLPFGNSTWPWYKWPMNTVIRTDWPTLKPWSFSIVWWSYQKVSLYLIIILHTDPEVCPSPE